MSKCARCGKAIRSKADKSSFVRYAPFCSYHCQEWASLEAAQRYLAERRRAKAEGRDAT